MGRLQSHSRKQAQLLPTSPLHGSVLPLRPWAQRHHQLFNLGAAAGPYKSIPGDLKPIGKHCGQQTKTKMFVLANSLKEVLAFGKSKSTTGIWTSKALRLPALGSWGFLWQGHTMETDYLLPHRLSVTNGTSRTGLWKTRTVYPSVQSFVWKHK